MDIFAHGLWTNAIFFNKKYKLWAVFFGILPDILSFGPFMLYVIFSEKASFSNQLVNSIPEVVFTGYNLTHSIIIFLIFFLAVYFITREIPWIMFGWPIHILTDIPSHTKEFFATPFLWPLSNFKINGINWGNPWFMAINYTLLISVYIWLYKRKHNNSKSML